MGLMDQIKETATDVVARGREGLSKGQAMLDDRKAKREAHVLLHDLGAAVYAVRTDRDGGSEARVDQLVARLREYEAAHGPLDLAAAAPEDESAPNGESAPSDQSAPSD